MSIKNKQMALKYRLLILLAALGAGLLMGKPVMFITRALGIESGQFYYSVFFTVLLILVPAFIVYQVVMWLKRIRKT